MLQATLCDLVRAYSSSPTETVYESLVRIALPQLAQLLAETGQDDDTRQKVDSSVVVIGAILDGRPSPIGEGFFNAIGQSLFDTLGRTDDDNVLQEGLECLTYVVRKDVAQLMQWYAPNPFFHIATCVLIHVEQASQGWTERACCTLPYHRTRIATGSLGISKLVHRRSSLTRLPPSWRCYPTYPS